jgi:hypothetical protein
VPLPVRDVTHVYEDPLDRIWISCAERIGLTVVRDGSAYATTDGRGRLSLATSAELDRDDSLAQMIFHELCHSLVEGPESLAKVDWGLDNVSGEHDVREHACLRLQALLTRPLGLARLLAPTTDFRVTFWDAIGPDPLAPDHEPSVVLARLAATRVGSAPWGPHLEQALRATADIAQRIAPYASGAGESLWSLIDPPAKAHPVGLPLAAPGTRAASERCESCAWSGAQGRGRRCRIAERAIRREWQACERWEPALSCERCGACCRQAFDTLVVDPRERTARRHPELVVLRGDLAEMPRPSGRCAALDGEPESAAGYRCRIYDDRPRTCRDFTVGSANCLLARRRVGATR